MAPNQDSIRRRIQQYEKSRGVRPEWEQNTRSERGKFSQDEGSCSIIASPQPTEKASGSRFQRSHAVDIPGSIREQHAVFALGGAISEQHQSPLAGFER